MHVSVMTTDSVNAPLPVEPVCCSNLIARIKQTQVLVSEVTVTVPLKTNVRVTHGGSALNKAVTVMNVFSCFVCSALE